MNKISKRLEKRAKELGIVTVHLDGSSNTEGYIKATEAVFDVVERLQSTAEVKEFFNK